MTTVTVPGVNEFAKINAIGTREELPSWTQGLSQEDINSMHRKHFFHHKSWFFLPFWSFFHFGFHIIFECFLIALLNFRVGSLIAGGFDFWNQKTLRSSISIGCWRSARNDQRQIFEHILTKQSKKIKWTTLGQIAELVTNNIPLP